MRSATRLGWILLTVLAGGCGGSTPPSAPDAGGYTEPPTDDPDPDRYAVYSALLNALYPADTRALVVIDRTMTGTPPDMLERFPDLPSEVAAAFTDVSAVPAGVTDRFTVPFHIEVASMEEIFACMPVESDLQATAFSEHFSGAWAFVRLSEVAFGEDRDLAFVCSGSWCGSLCGEGLCAVAERDEDGEWIITDIEGLWIS